MRQERYSIVHRLHRDRLEELNRQTSGTDWLACSSCIRPHPQKYFSSAEQKKHVQTRKCLASTASIRLCSHWTEHLQSLRQRREDADCGPRPVDFFRTDRCVHVDHEFQGFSAPCMRDLGSTFSVERHITLLQTKNRVVIDQDAVEDVLTSHTFRDIRICPHIRLGDQAIISSFTCRPPTGDCDHSAGGDDVGRLSSTAVRDVGPAGGVGVALGDGCE